MLFSTYEETTARISLEQKLKKLVDDVYELSEDYEISYTYDEIEKLINLHDSDYGVFFDAIEQLQDKLGNRGIYYTFNLLDKIPISLYDSSKERCLDILKSSMRYNYETPLNSAYDVLSKVSHSAPTYIYDDILSVLEDSPRSGHEDKVLDILYDLSYFSVEHNQAKRICAILDDIVKEHNGVAYYQDRVYEVFERLIGSSTEYSEQILDKILDKIIEYNQKRPCVKSAKALIMISKRCPQASEKIFAQAKYLLEADIGNYDKIYEIFPHVLKQNKDLTADVVDVMHTSIKSAKNNSDSFNVAYMVYNDIMENSSEFMDTILEDTLYCIKNGNEYNSWANLLCYQIMEEKPDSAGKILQAINENIAGREKQNIPESAFNFASNMMEYAAINKLLPFDKILDTADVIISTDAQNDNQIVICPCLAELAKNKDAPVERIIKQLETSILKSYKYFEEKGWDITPKGYPALSEVVRDNPSCADILLEKTDEKILSEKSKMYELISTISEVRPDLIPVLEKKYPDINIKALSIAFKISQTIDSSCEDIYLSKYSVLSELQDEEEKRINFIFSTKQLDNEDKKILCLMFNDDKLPIKDIAEFNPGTYNEIKEYMLLQECKAHPDLSKEEVYKRNKEWLLESAINVAVLYKKNYRQYFNVIEKYNEQLPKLKEMMPEVRKEAQEKEEKLRTQLHPIQQERAKLSSKRNNKLISSEKRQENRLRYDELGITERGLKGNLRGVIGYIDYDKLRPIGMEKATAWMSDALKSTDRTGLLKKINSSLLGTNPNILACGKSGQPFIRVEHQVPKLDNAGYRNGVKVVDELMLVASRWDNLPIEVKAGGFKEIVEAANAYKFNGENIEFMQANGKYISNQKTYDKAEAIYERGRLTPSRFERKEHYSKDGNWRCYIADKDDPRPLYAGGNWSDRAKCCQSYGSAGSTCAIDSVLNPDSGCVIFERKTKVKDEFGTEQEVWEMQGCSWCYEVQSGEYKKLIFDNVEINNGYKYELKSVNEVFDAMVADLGKDNYSEIRMGYSPDLGERKDSKAVKNEALPHGYSGYSDASTQYVLLKNPTATPEQLPEVMIVGMDLEKHKAGMSKVAAKAFPDGSQHLEIPKDAKGIVLVNRSNEVLGYVIWTEKSRETHEEKPVKNWITDMAVSPEYRGKTGFKLLTEMMKHVQKTGGTWGAELRDSTSFKYIMTMSDKVKNGEIAGVDSDFRGRAKVDLEVVELAYVMNKDSKTGESSKVYRCVFTPLTEEETKARLQARKIEEREIQARGKIEEKHSQQSQQLQQAKIDVKEVLPSIISQAVTGTTKEVR